MLYSDEISKYVCVCVCTCTLFVVSEGDLELPNQHVSGSTIHVTKKPQT